MALTLQQVRDIPEFSGMSDSDIIAHGNANGMDTSSMIPDTSNEAGAFRSNVSIPLLKGVGDIGGSVGYGLEKAGATKLGQGLQQSNESLQTTLTARQSQQTQEDAKKTLIDDNGNYGGYNLGTLSQDVFGSLPGTVVMGAVGAPLATGASMVSKAAGLGGKIAEIASSGALGSSLAKGLTAATIDTTLGSAAGFGAAEGIYSGASNAAQIQNQIRSTDINTLAEHPLFADVYHKETDPLLTPDERLQQTRDILATKAGDDVFANTAIQTGLISMATGGGVYGMLRGNSLAKDEIKDGVLKRAAKGFALEGMAQEAPQSALEQRTNNQALQNYVDPNQDIGQGVVNAGLQGGVAGGVMGLAGGGGSSPNPTTSPDNKKPEVWQHSTQYDDSFNTAATKYGVPVDVLKALAMQESGIHQFDKNGKTVQPSTSNALGIMQIIPKWHPEFDQTKLANDPDYNIHAGAKFLSELIQKHDGDVNQALKGYYGSRDDQANQSYADSVMSKIGSANNNPNTQSDATQLDPSLNSLVADDQLQGTPNPDNVINNTADADPLTQLENINGGQESTSENQNANAQEKGLLSTDALEQSGATSLIDNAPHDPLVSVIDRNTGTAFHVLQSDLDSNKDRLTKHSVTTGKRLLTPILRQDIVDEQTYQQELADQQQRQDEQANQQTETQAQDQTSADQSTAVTFQPTHELNDGTQVKQVGDNTYVDQAGDEWGADDAKAIGKLDTATNDTSTEGQGNNTGSNLPSYATAPLLNKRTNQPFKTRKMAEVAIASSSNPTLNKQDHIAVPVDGGFGIVSKPNTTQGNNDTATETQSVLSNTGTNAKGITAPETIDATGQGSTQTAQEVAIQNTKVELPQKLYETPVKSLGASVKDFVQSKVSEATTFTESNGKFYIGGTAGAGLKQVTKAVHIYGKAYQKHLTDAYDAQDKIDAEAINQSSNTQATATVAKPQEYDKLFDTLETKETDKGTILFSRSKSTKDRYEQRIDELFSGDKPNQESDIAVLDSSDVLSMLGYAKEKIYLVEKKVILSTKEENHNMTADLWKKIPEWLENPVAVFDSETEKGRLVFVAPETLNGDPIFMIVEPNAMRGRTKVYLLINGYDRSSDKIPSARWIRDEKLRYIDNSKSRAISAASRLQLPAREQQNKPGSRVKILTEKNLVKYRQQNNTLNSISTNPVVNPHSKTSLNQAVTKAMDSLFGQGWTNRLMATGKFKVISRDEAVQIAGSTAANAKGFFNSDTDITYLVYDNIEQDASSKALVGLMLHEISTHSLNLGKSSEAFQDILRRFEALKATNPKVQAAFANVPASTPDEHKVEEALAEYLAENPKSSLAQRIIEWFRQAVRALGKTLPVLERAKFSQWANKLTEAELIGMATSALKSAPDSLQFDNVGRNREGIKFVKIPQSDIKLGQKVNDPVKVSGDPNLWVIPEEVTVRTKGRFTSKPIRLLMGKHFGKNHGFGLTHIEAGHAKEIAETGMTTEQWVISVIKSATKIFDNGSDRLIIYSAKAPKGAAFIELRNDGDFYSVITAYNTEPKGKIVWSGRRHLISSEGSNVSGTQGTVATTTGLPINPTVRTDTIAGKSSAQSRETLTDQTTDETISQQENNSSNNIKFSRSTPSNTPADNSAMRSFFAPAKGKQALGWLAGFFQRNHLIDFVAKDLPELINYKLLSQEKDNFTNQRENEIGKSYKEMLDKMDKKTMHELGRVQGMATRLVKFDPALADDNTPMTEEELAAYDAYTAMPESAKEAYATMRKAYQDDLTEKKNALKERIKAFPADKETQAEIIRTIEEHFDQFKEGVYFPLNRDGAVIVKATNADGELVIEHVATQAAAYKLVKEMTAQGYDNTHIIGKDAYDRDLLAGNAANEMAALAHKTISDLKEKSVQGKLTESDFNDLFSEFNQLLINTLPDSSYRKHFIHRKGTLGESTDTLRAYAKTRTSAVKMIASLTYDHQIQDVLNNADKAIKEMDEVAGSDTLAIKSIVNELKLRESALKSTEINAVSQVLTSLGFMGALGFNIGSAAVNMLQVVGVALPELIGRHGEVEAMKEIASAYKLLFNPANLDKASGLDIIKNPKLTAIEKQAMKHLASIGKIDLTMTHDSIAAGKDPSYSSNPATRAFGAAAKYSGYFFHVAEAANRQITGIAAFNLAYKKNGGNFEAAIAEAVDVIDRTQFDYGQGNRARYMMSNTARVLTLFKAYALGMSYFIGRNAMLSMKGETPEVRLQARKTLVASMVMSFATAGLFGMPIGIEAFAGIGGVAAFKYKGAKFAVPGAIGGMLIFQALLAGLGADDEDELETEFRNWLTDNFDQTTAEWVTKGPARLLPIGDISGRTSLSELWWRSQNKQLEGTDQYNAIATALIGPIGSQIAGLFTAKKMYEDGQYSRMVESMSPAFLRNAIAANRMGSEGVTNLKGDKIIQRGLTPVELINKVIGFNPTVVTNTYDANSAIAKESTKHTLGKSHLVNRWMSGDATERSDLMKGAIKDFNESVPPSERITLKSLFKSMRSRKGIDKHTKNGLYLSKKQNYLRDIGRFNRQE